LIKQNQLRTEYLYIRPLGDVAFLIPVKGREPGLRAQAELADDAHEPVL